MVGAGSFLVNAEAFVDDAGDLGCAEDSVSDVFGDGDLVEVRHQVKQGEDALLSKRIEDLADAEDGVLFRGADGVKLLEALPISGHFRLSSRSLPWGWSTAKSTV